MSNVEHGKTSVNNHFYSMSQITRHFCDPLDFLFEMLNKAWSVFCESRMYAKYTITTKSEGNSLFDCIVTLLINPFPAFFFQKCLLHRLLIKKLHMSSVEQNEIIRQILCALIWNCSMHELSICLLKGKTHSFITFDIFAISRQLHALIVYSTKQFLDPTCTCI
jgi:hypothetical protein